MFAPAQSPDTLRPGEKRGDLGRIVVVGGNGFLGHHIVNLALSQWKADVSSVDLRCDRNRNPDAAYYECDITDRQKLLSILEDVKPDVVIHTASPVADNYKANKELFWKVNVEGTQSVVDACQKAGVMGLVYTCSASVISDNVTDLHNADERWPVPRGKDQTDYYAETKAAAEEVVLAANRSESPSSANKLLTTSIRPAGLFGEGDVQLLAGFIRAYRTGKSNVQVGDNLNLFDFTYVGNVAHSHLLAAHLLRATAAASTPPLDLERVDGEAFFITNDSPCYFWDFARAVYRAAGSEAGTSGVWTLSSDFGWLLGLLSEGFSAAVGRQPTFTRLRAKFSCMTRYYNITKAKRVLRYQPLWSLQDALDRSVKWTLEQEKKETAKAQ